MKLDYDKETDSLYIHLFDKPGSDVMIVNDDMIVDIDEDGNPVGIDIQHASKRVNLNSLETTSFPVGKLKVSTV